LPLNHKGARHIIYGLQPDKVINKYSFNDSLSSNVLTIWQLRKNFKQFKIYLDLLCSAKISLSKYPEATLLRKVFCGIENQSLTKPFPAQQITLGLLQLGSGYYLEKMQSHLKYFESSLTPQYREIMARMDFHLPKKDELIFHTCNPDIYLYIPPIIKFPKKLVILFPTKSNTFNMPRHIAHFIFANQGVALMYVGNRPNLSMGNALIHHSNEESAELILKIAEEYGFNELYGLGTSYGGYMICQLAERLGLKKVLNFSGAQKEPQVEQKTSMMSMRSSYPMKNILSVLSKDDPVDLEILKAYDSEGFETPRVFLSSKSHGSFSSAFLEGKVNNFFAWMLN
jgi:hypothetical protein